MKNKQFAYVIAPEGCASHLTPGKKYSAVCVVKYKRAYGFYFRDDSDVEHLSTHRSHRHTNDNLWIIPEIGKWPKGWTEQQKNECLQKAGVIEEPTNDNQGRSDEQLQGSYKIMNICFIALFVLIVLSAILI